jgi:hypothetical protein
MLLTPKTEKIVTREVSRFYDNYMKTLSGLILFLGLTVCATAQVTNNTGSISGKLRDETTGEAIEFAAMNLSSSGNTGYFKNLMTENDGSFLFDDVPFGSYRIKISFLGFESRIIEDIQINKDNQNHNLGLVRIKQASHTLDELVITATKPQIEFKGDTVVYNVSQSLLATGMYLW